MSNTALEIVYQASLDTLQALAVEMACESTYPTDPERLATLRAEYASALECDPMAQCDPMARVIPRPPVSRETLGSG